MNRFTKHTAALAAIVGGLVFVTGAQAATAIYAIVNIGGASWTTDLKNEIVDTGLIAADQITEIDVGATPTLATLEQYKAVITTGNNNAASASGLGDVLADYVDAGGGVVNTIFGYSPFYIAGRWDTQNYSALPDVVGTNHFPGNVSLGTVNDPSEAPANQLFNGVSTVFTNLDAGTDSQHYHITTANTGAILVATWDNGDALAALKYDPNGTGTGYTVGLNMFGASSTVAPGAWDPTSDANRLIANSLLFVTPEPTSLSLLVIGGGLLLSRRRQMRNA